MLLTDKTPFSFLVDNDMTRVFDNKTQIGVPQDVGLRWVNITELTDDDFLKIDNFFDQKNNP